MRRPLAAVGLGLTLGCGGPLGAPDAGAWGGDAGRPDAGPCVPLELPADALAATRLSCAFEAGASPRQTLGLDRATVARIPIDHVVVVMQENRSFDHLFATLHDTRPEVEAIPAAYVNPDRAGVPVRPFHLTSGCLPADPPHQWDAMHAQWNGGAMDGFVRTAAVGGLDGHYATGFHDASDTPFYHWLARTFPLADRHFASVLAGTWANRAVLYTGSTHGLRNTGEFTIADAPTVFDALDARGVSWGVYVDGTPRQDLLGWTAAHRGVAPFSALLDALSSGSLPSVSFVDPTEMQDEHPPNDVRGGEAWSRRVYEASTSSPLWPRLAVVFTYDEGGGLFDHVPPPSACMPSPGLEGTDVLGHRVPLLVVSPWSRPGHVSHVVHDHASVLRFIQLLFDLPALSARDANADALLDMFEFSCPPPFAEAPRSPAAGDAQVCP